MTRRGGAMTFVQMSQNKIHEIKYTYQFIIYNQCTEKWFLHLKMTHHCGAITFVQTTEHRML
jgi:hypothetical protein